MCECIHGGYKSREGTVSVEQVEARDAATHRLALTGNYLTNAMLPTP